MHEPIIIEADDWPSQREIADADVVVVSGQLVKSRYTTTDAEPAEAVAAVHRIHAWERLRGFLGDRADPSVTIARDAAGDWSVHLAWGEIAVALGYGSTAEEALAQALEQVRP